MPIARFQMPDGRIAKFEVPEGAPLDQINRMLQETVRATPPEDQKAAIPGPVGQGPGDPQGVVSGASPVQPPRPQDTAVQPIEPVGVATGTPSIDALLQGVSLGTYDELQAGTGAAVDKLRSLLTGRPVDFLDRYREYHKQLGEGREAYREAAPVTSLVNELGGGLLSGGGLLGMGRQVAKGVGRLAAEGAGAGAVAGAATAEPGERMGGLVGGAALGGALGGGMAAASGAGRRVAEAVRDRGKATKAQRFARKKVQKELGMTSEEAQVRMREMGPEATLTDVGGKDVEALAYRVANTPGQASDMMENFLEERSKGEYGRLMTRAKELLGTKREYFESIDALKAEREELAGPLYERARQVPLRMTDGLRSVLKLPTMRKAVKAGRAKAADDGIELAPDELNVTALDYAKRSLDDKIGAAIRAGKSDRASQLQKMKKRLLGEMDAQNEDYAKARAVWSGSKEVENAIEAGAMFARGDSDMLSREFAALTPTERDAFRIGAMRGLRNMIAKVRDTNSIAQRFQNPAMRERLGVIFPTEKAYDEFLQAVVGEARFAEVRNRVLRGSQTAPRQRREGLDEDLRGAVTEGMVTGGIPFANILRSTARRVGVGPSPEQAREIARLLTTPQQVLSQGVRPAQPTLQQLLLQRASGGLGGAGGLLYGQ